ncbi:MAG: hypothetical protein ABIN08_12780 [Caldimonas sp.]
MASAMNAAASNLAQQLVLEHSAEGLARSLRRIAAQHRDDSEVLEVCEKWTIRLSEFQRRVVSAGVEAQPVRQREARAVSTRPDKNAAHRGTPRLDEFMVAKA